MMTFKEFYLSKYPHLTNWGEDGERTADVMTRLTDELSLYIDYVISIRLGK